MTLVFERGTNGGPGTHALVIGAGDVGAAPLPGAAASAHEIASWLVRKYRNPTAPLSSLELLISSQSQEHTVFPEPDRPADLAPPTYVNFSRSIQEWFKRADDHSDNLAFFFFAGHGAGLGEDTGLLIDTRVGDEHPVLISLRDTIAALETNRAGRQLFVSDTSRSQSSERGLATAPLTLEARTKAGFPRRAVFQSAAPGQDAYDEYEGGRGSHFSEAFMQSLETARLDSRGAITVDALQSELRSRAAAMMKSDGIDQMPQIELTGDFDFHYRVVAGNPPPKVAVEEGKH
jgi:hypothetical protein